MTAEYSVQASRQRNLLQRTQESIAEAIVFAVGNVILRYQRRKKKRAWNKELVEGRQRS
jgi:hypothetical protein